MSSVDGYRQSVQVNERSLGHRTESVVDRLASYLPPPELLAAYPSPGPVEHERRERYQAKRPGCDYSLVAYQGKMIVVPAWHPLNTESQIAHANQYGTGMFEGGSVEPVTNEAGEIVGANAILVEARLNRMFGRSVEGRPGIVPPVPRAEFEQAMLDYAAILGRKVLVTPDGHVARAYLRPSMAPGEGALGIGVKDQVINAAVEAWTWPYYFSDPERVYGGSGLVVSAGPNQRLSPIHGKHASNYGDAARVGNLARAVGADEALYFGPYTVNRDGSRGKREVTLDDFRRGRADISIPQTLQSLVIADGPGEEVMAITVDGEIWLPPMDVNRLGGTTADYVMKHLAPSLGLRVKERRFSLRDIAQPDNPTGKIAGLLFAGNASRLAPIGEIRLQGIHGEQIGEYHLPIPEDMRRLVDRYEREVRGQVEPSDPSLLTPIDLDGGEQARAILDQVYAAWFE